MAPAEPLQLKVVEAGGGGQSRTAANLMAMCILY